MYLKVPVPANKGTRLLLRSTNASHLLLLISEPRLGWLDHQHPAAAQPKSPWEHPPADHPHRPGSHQQSHCPLSSFQKLNFAAFIDQIFHLKVRRSPPKHNLSLPSNSHSHLLWTVDVDLSGRGAGESRTASILQLKNNSVPHQRIWRRCVDQGPLQLHSLSSAPSRLCCRLKSL